MENLDNPNDLAVKSMLFLILLNPASVVTNEMVENLTLQAQEEELSNLK